MFKKSIKLKSVVFTVAVLAVLSGCGLKNKLIREDFLKVGFDVDDTLLFSTPAFQKGFKSKAEPFSETFWVIVNSSDRGNSIVKKKPRRILEEHRKKGDKIYIITARKPYGGEDLKSFLNETFLVPENNIYFETDGKTERIRQVELDIYYGDSDSDITDAQVAGAAVYRIERSTASSYNAKYNPGKFGEEIIENSKW